MPSGYFAICTAPRPNRICGIHSFFVPFQASHDGTHDHQWKPEMSNPGNTEAESPAIIAAPERRTPHSTTLAIHSRPTEVVNDSLLADACTETRRNPPNPARPAEMAKIHSLAAGMEIPDDEAAGSEARTARAARPVGEFLRLRIPRLTNTIIITRTTAIVFKSERPKGTEIFNPL